MCISSNWVNDAQDSIAVKKFRDFQNSLIPSVKLALSTNRMPSLSTEKFREVPLTALLYRYQEIFITRPRAARQRQWGYLLGSENDE